MIKEMSIGPFMGRRLVRLSMVNCLLGIFLVSGAVAQQPPGTVIDHIPKTTGKYVGSPSICILPDGSYVTSHDEFGPKSGENAVAVTRVFHSPDKGETWKEIAVIEGLFWSNLFVHDGDLYNMGASKVHGDFVLRKSSDGGKTWTNPDSSDTGLILEGEHHTAPMPVLVHNGRIWRTVEYAKAPTNEWGKRYSAMIVSAPVDSDLLNAKNWKKSNYLIYRPEYLEGHFGGWLEGNPVVSPEGKILNILRVDTKGGKQGEEYAAVVEVDENGEKIHFNPKTGFIKFPGGCKKFEIRHDEHSKRYWTMSNAVAPKYQGINVDERTRNLLVLSSSKDLKTWQMHAVLLHHPDVKKHGFQYADFQFDGEDIIFVSRTAFDDESGGADNCHNANYLTFHRVPDFRKLVTVILDINVL